jgi:hypothetical protein
MNLQARILKLLIAQSHDFGRVSDDPDSLANGRVGELGESLVRKTEPFKRPLAAVLQESVAPLADRSGVDVHLARHRFVVTPSVAQASTMRARRASVGAERDR